MVFNDRILIKPFMLTTYHYSATRCTFLGWRKWIQEAFKSTFESKNGCYSSHSKTCTKVFRTHTRIRSNFWLNFGQRRKSSVKVNIVTRFNLFTLETSPNTEKTQNKGRRICHFRISGQIRDFLESSYLVQNQNEISIKRTGMQKFADHLFQARK